MSNNLRNAVGPNQLHSIETEIRNSTSETSGLPEIAASINTQHQGVMQMSRSGLECARTAGVLLIHAKSHFKHGQWLQWIEANLECSERTVQTYMRIAHNWDELERNCDENTQDLADLGLERALKLIRKPKALTHTEPEVPQTSHDSKVHPRSAQGAVPTKAGVNRKLKEKQPELKSAPTPLQTEATSPWDASEFVDSLAESVRELETLAIPIMPIAGEPATVILKLINDGISVLTKLKEALADARTAK